MSYADDVSGADRRAPMAGAKARLEGAKIPINGTGNSRIVFQSTRPALFATLLTVLAGTLDAAAYIELNHLYVSFMSGNSTHLGMVLAAGALPDILAVITIILAFVVGASVGTFIADRAGRHMLTAVLGAEALLVLIAVVLALCGGAHTALVLIAIAMGAQNVLHQVIAGSDVGKGFITGALFGLGQSVARLFRDEGAAARSASNMLSWCAFVGGAAAGTLCLASLGLVGCLVAAAFLILVLLIAALARWL